MSLLEPRKVSTKAELIKALSNTSIEFIGEHEVVDDAGLRKVSDVVKSLVRSKKNIQIVIVHKKKVSK